MSNIQNNTDRSVGRELANMMSNLGKILLSDLALPLVKVNHS